MTFSAFATREEAGRRLGDRLKSMKLERPVVLALPRGGVPVAAEVAKALSAPLDLLLVRKIGVPWQPELAAAAVVDGEHPQLVLNEDVMAAVGVRRDDVDAAMKRELVEIERRRKFYLGGRQPVSVAGCTAIAVDDGLATGTTARAALRALRSRGPRRVILAVPVAPPDTIADLQNEADEIVCLEQPVPFYAIGVFYRDFHQLEDEEVVRLMASVAAAGGKRD